MKFENNIIVFDFETGGLSPQKNPATEIGVVVYNSNGDIIHEYSTFIQGYDDLEYNPKALELTGITMDDIKSGITKEELVIKLKSIFTEFKVKGRAGKPILAGHNVNFDLGFLTHIFSDYSKYVNEIVLDTLLLSRLAWGMGNELPNFQLGTCCSHLGINLSGAHRALADVKATGELLFYHINMMRGQGESNSSNQEKAISFRESFIIP